MPFEATPFIFYTTDTIYVVAVLSHEMGFTLTLPVWLPTTKPFTPTGRESYTGTETRPLLHEEAGYHLTKKLTRQDAN